MHFARPVSPFSLLVATLILLGIGLPPSATADAQPWDIPYPQARSKKGLQVEVVADALKLGIKHAAINLDLVRLIDPKRDPANPTWQFEGESYSFRRDYLQRLDSDIRVLSQRGVLVNVILLTYQSGTIADEILIHPNCDPNAPNRLGAFNTRTDLGKQWLEATIQFLAARWSGKDESGPRVCGWIVGNEVNSHWWWSNMGRVTMDQFVQDYAQAVRLVHRAVRSQVTSDRIYVSLEHHWKIRYPAGDSLQSFPGHDFLEAFAAHIRDQGDIDWNVAFHPYPENLFDPRFWKDESAPDDDNAARVTFRNLPVLLRFLKQTSLTFEGRPRHVILSEQGFHSDGTAQGEQLQAAAWCFAYRLVESLDGIDALILHRHIDHPAEGGLNLGLRRRAAKGQGDFEQQFPRKPIYECFRVADTDQWREAFEFALPIVGLKEWHN